MRLLFAILLLSVVVSAQTPIPATPPAAVKVSPALQLLRDVGDKYANAKSYWIEAVEEVTRTQDLRRDWSKSFFTAAQAPDQKYRFSGRDDLGDSLLVSDGVKEWHLRTLSKSYTEAPAERDPQNKRIGGAMSDYAASRARFLGRDIQRLSKGLKDARFLPDENVLVEGRAIRCKVVAFTTADFAKKTETGANITYTVWIDSERELVVKKTESGVSMIYTDDRNHPLPFKLDEVILYPKAEVDPSFPKDYFRFQPPAEAKLVESFQDGIPDFEKLMKAMIGKPAPDVSLDRGDGTTLSLASLRGKPVLLDLWATWCEPCVDAIPEMTKLYSELKSTPLQWYSVDMQDDPAKVKEFLSKRNLPWTNYHDAAGSLMRTFNTPGIPSVVLIDADGKVAYIGGSLKEVRTAISKLGAEFEKIDNIQSSTGGSSTNHDR